MPVFGPGSTRIEDVWLKPPIMLKIKILANALANARKRLGSKHDAQTIVSVVYALDIEVCKEGEPQCATGVHALTVEVIGALATNRWDLTIRFMQFYVLIPTSVAVKLFDFGKETDVNVNVDFTDSVVAVIAQGSEVLRTNMFKKFEMIKALRAYNRFTTDGGLRFQAMTNRLS